RHDTVIVPLTGSMTSDRAEQLISSVLKHIETNRIRTTILDVTGVPVVDTHVGQVILRTADAARLMGSRTVLVGIRPEVAQTLVSLGINLDELQPASTLQTALERVA
ncbi:MAG: STAS domain-containing protein, partial [Herpetosiphon sp.]|nr:STAS domain-containing protein [Herpetosiphon sp.]